MGRAAVLLCFALAAPRVAECAAPAGPIPVVLVPGMTGTDLRDRATGSLVWGDGQSLVRPHDGGHALALPVAPGPAPRSAVEAGDVLLEVRLWRLIRKPIYGPIVRLLAEQGYRPGDLDAPSAGESFYLFPYDWRLDSTEVAHLLAERLEALRRARGEERLRLDLVCQSSAAHICRYLVKYGGASLEEAEAGRAGPPPRVEVRQLVLVGTANGGSLRILRELNRGRRYLPIIGRRFLPETFFTFPSLYQDLPSYRRDLFLDPRGEPIEIDLFDPASWERYGWSVYGREARQRLARNPRPDLFADPEGRQAFLRSALDRARRLHRLLARDAPRFGPTRYHLLQSVQTPTPEGAVLVRKRDGWRTLFSGDPKLRRRPRLHALATAPGDGHATRQSQLWLSPQERAAMAGPPFYVRGGHFELILEPEALRFLIAVLREGDDASSYSPLSVITERAAQANLDLPAVAGALEREPQGLPRAAALEEEE